MSNISLLGSTSRIETPYIKVTFGSKETGYTFGVYSRTDAAKKDLQGFYQIAKITYPNYIQSLSITKINGQVNTYKLVLNYPIRQGDDPNFFEKVFSSVSKTRKILFSYGDMSLPTFIYKEEEALITNVTTQFSIATSLITYNIEAVSSAVLASVGNFTFINTNDKKPSDEIKRVLFDKTYGLQDIFYGMNDRGLVLTEGLIPGDDQEVPLQSFSNKSILDYLTYLVSAMVPSSAVATSLEQNSIYVLTIMDDVSGEFGGPYFKIVKMTNKITSSDAYEINIGYPEANIVTSFNIDNNENYSIFYDWSTKLIPEQYVRKIDNKGNWTNEYSPNISSGNDQYTTRTADKTWWTKITQYPISVTLTIKGLLRPAILMTYVRLNVYFWGQKHISSGLYIVTKQQDTVDTNGCRTVLNLTRISGDE